MVIGALLRMFLNGASLGEVMEPGESLQHLDEDVGRGSSLVGGSSSDDDDVDEDRHLKKKNMVRLLLVLVLLLLLLMMMKGKRIIFVELQIIIIK